MKQQTGFRCLTLTLLLMCSIPLLPVTPLEAEDEEQSDVKGVNRVVKYKNGMTYFERTATVQVNERVKLQFPADQMMDVLPTIYVVDPDGGSITNISYESKRPVSDRVSELLIDVPETETVRKLLRQLQGVRVSFEMAERELSGSVLGTQTEETGSNGTVLTYHTVTMQTDDGSTRSVDMRDVQSFRIQDEEVRKEIEKFLKLRLERRRKDLKTVVIHAEGDGKRTIRIGYQLSGPAWKSSYRLMLSDDEKPFLQGWATVENQTNEDWNRVSMELVAGQPISFKLDMYTPFYPERHQIDIDTLFPDATLAQLEEMTTQLDQAAVRARGGSGRGIGAEKSAASLKKAASGDFLGETFRYRIDRPVTVEQNESTLVPILASSVDGTERLYYNQKVSNSPMNAIHINNTTGATLDLGQVTVYRENTALGESLISRILQPGMQAVLPYSVETALVVQLQRNKEPRPVSRISVKDGILEAHQEQRVVTEYQLNSHLNEERSLLVDHQTQSEYDLVSPEKYMENIAGGYRFETSVPANDEDTFTVVEARETSSTYQLMDVDLDRLELYLRNVELTEKQRELLKTVREKRSEMRRIQNDIDAKQEELSRIESTQKRLRNNFEPLARDGEEGKIRARFLERLETNEKEYRDLEANLQSARQKQNQLRDELQTLIEAF